MRIFNKIKLLPNAILGFERSDPFRNGEYKFLRSFIKNKMMVFDVGAHKGDYTTYILNLHRSITIHCFEPSAKTFTELIINLKDEITGENVHCNNFGLSNKDEEAEMYIYNDLDERNSLHLNNSHNYDQKLLYKEKIFLSTLDKYIDENKILKVDFLKIDVEGHETKVIDGAYDSLKQKKIKCIQFEYNNNWLAAGFTLEKVFNELAALNFKFFRLAIWGKIPISRFSSKHENYKHANYIALLNE